MKTNKIGTWTITFAAVAVGFCQTAEASEPPPGCISGADLFADPNVSFPTRAPVVNGTSLRFAPGAGQAILIDIPLFAPGELASDAYVEVSAIVNRTRIGTDDDMDVVVFAGDQFNGQQGIGVAAQDNYNGVLIAYRLPFYGDFYNFYGSGFEQTFITPLSGVGSALGGFNEVTEYDMSVELGCSTTTAAGTWGFESGQRTFLTELDRAAGLRLMVLAENSSESYELNYLCIDTHVETFNQACALCTQGNCSDTDGDGFEDSVDNCHLTANSDQADLDLDDQGDACDPCVFDPDDDIDDDGFCADVDNCPLDVNPDQFDTDLDGEGDSCDLDIDEDSVPNEFDNCPYDINNAQADIDGDGIGDICDGDADGDGVVDADDQCLSPTNGEAVDETGCTIADQCPCTPADGAWKNHGKYVSCVSNTASDFVDAGLISEADKDATMSAAGASSCGKKAK